MLFEEDISVISNMFRTVTNFILQLFLSIHYSVLMNGSNRILMAEILVVITSLGLPNENQADGFAETVIA